LATQLFKDEIWSKKIYGEKYIKGYFDFQMKIFMVKSILKVFFLLSDEQLFLLQKAMILNSPRGVLNGRERERKKNTHLQ
jgi:hypothetical protein